MKEETKVLVTKIIHIYLLVLFLFLSFLSILSFFHTYYYSIVGSSHLYALSLMCLSFVTFISLLFRVKFCYYLSAFSSIIIFSLSRICFLVTEYTVGRAFHDILFVSTFFISIFAIYLNTKGR